MFGKPQRIFLDYASTTPTDRRVISAMRPYFRDTFHNASALYTEGVTARAAIDRARKTIARLVQAKPAEIVFTSSGTESNNLAIIGIARAVLERAHKEHKEFRPHIITTNIEHVSVLEACRYLSRNEHVDVTYVPVDTHGVVTAAQIEKVLRPETVLVSVMFVNNEIGTIQPIRNIGVALREYKKKQNRVVADFPYFHTDASQGPNYLDVNIDQLHADLMTLDGSKIYGPKGAGCLVIKGHVPITAILYGGGHEMRMRPGTENTPQIVGFAKALEIADQRRNTDAMHMTELQHYFIEMLQKEIPKATINGDIKKRIANNVNICIQGLNAEFAVIQLDQIGICCAAMTACKNLSGEASSYVVAALGGDCEKSSLRFTMGRSTTKRHIRKVIAGITHVCLQQGIAIA